MSDPTPLLSPTTAKPTAAVCCVCGRPGQIGPDLRVTATDKIVHPQCHRQLWAPVKEA